MKQPAQGHTARECWSWASTEGSLTLEFFPASGNFVWLVFDVETGGEVSFVLGITRGQPKEAENMQEPGGLRPPNLQKSSERK